MSTLVTQTVQSSTSAAPVFKNSSGTEKGQLATAWINFDGRFSDGIRDDLGYEFDDRGIRRTPYCLRHSFCTWSLQEGSCIERTRYLMGHSSIETTRGYLHLATILPSFFNMLRLLAFSFSR